MLMMRIFDLFSNVCSGGYGAVGRRHGPTLGGRQGIPAQPGNVQAEKRSICDVYTYTFMEGALKTLQRIGFSRLPLPPSLHCDIAKLREPGSKLQSW
jgi:hypothetical protein